MEEHVVSRISIKAVHRNYTCVRVCSWRAVGRYRAACVWIKENSQSLGRNFKVKRKSRLIRCTLWAFYSAAFTTFSLCFPRLDQARLPSCFWKKGERLSQERRSKSSFRFQCWICECSNPCTKVYVLHRHVNIRYLHGWANRFTPWSSGSLCIKWG